MTVVYVLLFVAICIASGPLCSDARNVNNYESSDIGLVHKRSTRFTKGASDWCRDATHDGHRFTTDECCGETYKCNHYINGNKTKYGLTNPSAHRKRHCECDEYFYECLTDSRTPLVRMQVRVLFARERCFRKKNCPSGNKCPGKDYEWLDSSTWLQNWN